jgi:hypothetical protein
LILVHSAVSRRRFFDLLDPEQNSNRSTRYP